MKRIKIGVKIMKTLFKTLFAVIMLGKSGLSQIEGIEAMGVSIA